MSVDKDKYDGAVETRGKKRSIMLFKTFSWFDILEERERSDNERTNKDPVIFTAKFR